MDKDFKIKDLGHFITVLRKRWPLSVIIFFTLTISVTWISLMQDSVFQASAKIVIGEGVTQKALGNSINSFQNYYYEQQEFATYPYIIRSIPVAKGIATRLNWIDPEKEAQLYDQWVSSLRYAVNIKRTGESRLFEILATHSAPEKAQELANTAADVFIQRNLEMKLNTFKKSFEWLTDQLVDLEYKLEDSQKDLIHYIEEERVTSFGDQPVLPNSVMVDQEFIESRGLQQRLNSRKVEQELELENLLRKYTEKHPKVIQAREALALTARKMQSQDKLLASQDRARETEAIRMKQTEIKYSILKRKVDINKELYNSLNQKMKEIDIASAINENNITVLEYAQLPGGPIRPKRARQILLGFLLATGLALISPLLLDYLDPTIQDIEDAEELLNLPILTSFPTFSKGPNGTENINFPALSPRSSDAEAFRILRTNIRFTLPASKSRTLLVTSSGPHEGKSTIAANLALTMAAAGQKVCLVDTDLRIPKIHKLFEIPNDRGLTNFIVGEEANIDNLFQKTTFDPNLFILTSGTSSPKPAELLETQKMDEVIQTLRKKFDQVIFDSPPSGNLIDASILGSKLDGVIFVLQAGKINKKHIKMAKTQLTRVNANICGVVLNKVKIPRDRSYYYYYYVKKEDEEEEENTAGKSESFRDADAPPSAPV